VFVSNSVSIAAPIAIYDSGVGGLTIAKAIKTLLPQESFHYIGDTKNLPYGDKSEAELRSYLLQVVHFCLSKQYKLLVLACNTATAVAERFLPAYLQQMGNPLQVLNVIDPVITHLLEQKGDVHVGLMGTQHTVRSGLYQARLCATSLTLSTLATPLLAPMVEAWFDGKRLFQSAINDCLKQLPFQSLQVLIPACTHYLFLEKAFRSFFIEQGNNKIQIMDVAQLTARAVKAFVLANNLLNTTQKKSSDCFMATQQTASFSRAVLHLFGAQVMLLDLDKYVQPTVLDFEGTTNWVGGY
jgi:glutamate racemase